MTKEMPSEGTSKERVAWKKGPYPLCIIKSEELDNPYFREKATCQKDKSHVFDEYVNPCPECGGDVYAAENIVERTQFRFTLEVLDGPKKGDWGWLYAPHYFRAKPSKKGSYGKRGDIARAIDPEFDLAAGIESDNSDLMFRPFMAMATPKDDPKYAAFSSFYPVDEDDPKLVAYEEYCQSLRLKDMGAEAVDSEGEAVSVMDDDAEEIPF